MKPPSLSFKLPALGECDFLRLRATFHHSISHPAKARFSLGHVQLPSQQRYDTYPVRFLDFLSPRQVSFTCCVEIFDVGGKTPPNRHRYPAEMFFILKGEGRATCDGKTIAIKLAS